MAERKVYPLRIDQRLDDALERWAADDLRSVNAQIEFLLRESLRRAGRLPAASGGSGDRRGGPPVDRGVRGTAGVVPRCIRRGGRPRRVGRPGRRRRPGCG
jgi:hypothetical protein